MLLFQFTFVILCNCEHFIKFREIKVNFAGSIRGEIVFLFWRRFMPFHFNKNEVMSLIQSSTIDISISDIYTLLSFDVNIITKNVVFIS